MPACKKNPLKCFLLVAGLGTRLRPLTESIPKCLLPIGEKTLLGIWLDHLSRHGVDEVLVNTYWLREKVETYLNSWQGKRPKIFLFHELNLLGSGGTLLAKRNWVEKSSPFFIIYGDNLTNIDLTKMLDFHKGHEMPFTLGVFRTDRPEECGIVETSNNGVVTGFVEKPEKPTSDIAAAGVYVADKTIFNYFPRVKLGDGGFKPQPIDLSFHVIPKLVGNMKAYFIREFLIDIGTQESYERAQNMWRQIVQEERRLNQANQ